MLWRGWVWRIALDAGVTAVDIAEVYAYLDNVDAAFHWPGTGIDSGHDMSLIRLSPFLRNIASDQRWLEILTRVGLADDQVSDINL